MAKNGLAQIGYIENWGSYAQVIKEKANIARIIFADFNNFIDNQWDDKYNTLLCYDEEGNQVPNSASNIKYFLIDTGYKDGDSNQTIYGRFYSPVPTSLDAGNWKGVEIETQPEFLKNVHNDSDKNCSFDEYSAGANYSLVCRILSRLARRDDLSEGICQEIIQESFSMAQQDGTLAVINNEQNSGKQISFFPLNGVTTVSGSRIFVKVEKNKDPEIAKWFGAFIVSEDELKDELLDYYILHTGYFVFESVSAVNDFYDALAEKASKENWKWSDSSRNGRFTQPILKSYLEYTYYRLLDEDAVADQEKKKIITEKGRRYFNSGLLDRTFRQIIIVGEALDLQREIPGLGLCKWKLMANIQAYSHSEHEIAKMFYENELPGIASYFTDYRQVVFNAGLDIHMNDNHIFEDGVARGRLSKYKDEYDEVKDNEVEKDLLLARIARDFDSARNRARLMAERNYKLAVPQFWKETGEIQFLLPIYLGEREEAERPQCALVLSLDNSGRRSYYRGETILTLDMAYNNTRLIAKPDVFWLNDLV